MIRKGGRVFLVGHPVRRRAVGLYSLRPRLRPPVHDDGRDLVRRRGGDQEFLRPISPLDQVVFYVLVQVVFYVLVDPSRFDAVSCKLTKATYRPSHEEIILLDVLCELLLPLEFKITDVQGGHLLG